MSKKLIVMIPAFNEAKKIRSVIGSIPRIKGVQTDIVVIDDGSSDRTAEIARKASANVVSFARNRGLVAAFNKGCETALALGADFIVNIDGDGQHNPKDIPRLVRPVIEGDADLVIGSRFMGNIEHMTFVKYFGNKLFSGLVSLLVKQRLTDTQSGFRAFSREVAENIDIRRGKSYTQQMIIQAAYHRFKIIDLPINVKARKGKSRLISNPFVFANQLFTLLLTTLAIYYPLRFFSLLGMLLIILGGLIGILFVKANVLSSVIILTGVQSFLFGVFFETLKVRKGK